MNIKYKQKKLSIEQLKTIICRSGIHRQTDNDQKLENMINHSTLLISAWDQDKIVGYIRVLTDYGDVAYVADLAVDKDYWDNGIGRELMNQVIELVGTEIHIVLLASELAKDYYSKLGFCHDSRGYVKLPKNPSPSDWTV